MSMAGWMMLGLHYAMLMGEAEKATALSVLWRNYVRKTFHVQSFHLHCWNVKLTDMP
ncbi:MAG: hypothetical protein ACSLEN_00175 [Candidatus Malihini olakiniferum]